MAMLQEHDYHMGGNDVGAISTSASAKKISTTGRIVVLNGFPGAGKFTILKQVKKLLPADRTILLDNHLLIDPVVAVLPSRNNEHYELRRNFRAPIFKKLGERAKEGCIVLMTACLADDNARDAAFFNEHLDMARGIDVPIFWVNVHCDQTALEQRLRSHERCHGTRTKLTDVDVLRALLRENRLIEPRQSADGFAMLVVETLDVSGPLELCVDHLMSMIGFPQNIAST